MSLIAQLLCLCVTASSGLLSEQSGIIRYKHETLGPRTHLLRLSIEYFFVDTDADRIRQMKTFAERFASQTCPGRFTVTQADRPSWPKIRPRLGEQFMFHYR